MSSHKLHCSGTSCKNISASCNRWSLLTSTLALTFTKGMVTSSYGSLSSLQASSVRSRTLPSRWISLSILPPRHSRLPTSLNRTPDLRPRTTPLLFEKSSRSNSTYPVVTCWWRSEWRLYVQWKNTNLTSCTSRRSNTISRNHRLYICSTLYAVYMYVYVQPLVQICELTQEQHLDCYVAFMLHSIQPYATWRQV